MYVANRAESGACGIYFGETDSRGTLVTTSCTNTKSLKTLLKLTVRKGNDSAAVEDKPSASPVGLFIKPYIEMPGGQSICFSIAK